MTLPPAETVAPGVKRAGPAADLSSGDCGQGV